jgi:hypothetical protein
MNEAPTIRCGGAFVNQLRLGRKLAQISQIQKQKQTRQKFDF